MSKRFVFSNNKRECVRRHIPIVGFDDLEVIETLQGIAWQIDNAELEAVNRLKEASSGFVLMEPIRCEFFTFLRQWTGKSEEAELCSAIFQLLGSWNSESVEGCTVFSGTFLNTETMFIVSNCVAELDESIGLIEVKIVLLHNNMILWLNESETA